VKFCEMTFLWTALNHVNGENTTKTRLNSTQSKPPPTTADVDGRSLSTKWFDLLLDSQCIKLLGVVNVASLE